MFSWTVAVSVAALLFKVRLAWAESLDGYGYHCGGDCLVYLSGTGTVVCGDDPKNPIPCGSYTYDGSSISLNLDQEGSFESTDLSILDGMLLGFVLNAQGGGFLTCTLRVLDWAETVLNPDDYYTHIDCDPNNEIPRGVGNISAEKHSFNMYPNAHVHHNSDTQLRGSFADTLFSDFYGVYVWNSKSAKIHLYFGPQSGEPAQRLVGTLSVDGTLRINDWYRGSSQSVCAPNFECTTYNTDILYDIAKNGDPHGWTEAQQGSNGSNGLPPSASSLSPVALALLLLPFSCVCASLPFVSMQ